MRSSAQQRMIKTQLEDRDIVDFRVLNAFRQVDRALFVPWDEREMAFEDRPLPIGSGQTISQPYIVAYMAQVLKPGPEDVILEIGTGCGYNAAILSRLAREVFSVEIFPELAVMANENLRHAGIFNVHLKVGDGFEGWPEKAPFDAIILTAAPESVPEALLSQLKIGGKLLAPVGTGYQNLQLYHRKSQDHCEMENLLPVQFVPMLRS